MHFFLITNAPSIAEFAVARGVDRIFVDLEKLGKAERQGHLDTVISDHSIDDVVAIRAVIPDGCLMVRINPVNANTADEIEGVIAAGADVVMLPMFKTPDEVRLATKLIAGRASLCLLVETVDAMEALEACASIEGVSEVHIGLNDLSLELGRSFMFEPLVDGTVERMAKTLARIGIKFGIGGVARVGEGLLPAELVIGEHVRLGSTAAILSRTFHRQAATVAEIEAQMDFAREVARLRSAYALAREMSVSELADNAALVRSRVEAIAAPLALQGAASR